MKIVHVCLCGCFTDGFSYQENLLTKYHKLNGHEVSMITSSWAYDESGVDIKRIPSGEYINSDGVKVIRIETKMNVNITNKFKVYRGLYSKIEAEKPDILFVHGCQFLDARIIRNYMRKYTETKLYIDNHADFSNSARGKISRYFLHGFLWKRCAQILLPYAEQFYGVLPARVDFLVNVYGLPKEKVSLLVMGADDELVLKSYDQNIRKAIREQYDIGQDDFLIVNGGKIDRWKTQTLLLMDAVNSIDNSKLRLLVFGSVTDDLKEKVIERCSDKVKYIGWVHSAESYNLFAAGDLACFPGRHSVFWEQVVGQGIPIICKYWPGTRHIDIDGNVIFLSEDSSEEIKRKILELLDDEERYSEMKRVAKEAQSMFLYNKISQMSIESTGN